MTRTRPSPRSNDAFSILSASLPRRQQRVQVGARNFTLDCLDDLDQVIDQMLVRLGPRGEVAEVRPHCGVVWPAAIALAEHLYEQWRDKLSALTVLELGCGLALPSMAAAQLGARRVIATDRHPLVPALLARNAAANGAENIEYRNLDWRHLLTPSDVHPFADVRFDLVLGSDLLYEAWQPGFLAHALPQLLTPSGQALITDPGRRYVDPFAAMLEAQGFQCELLGIQNVTHGRSRAEVLLLHVSRADFVQGMASDVCDGALAS